MYNSKLVFGLTASKIYAKEFCPILESNAAGFFRPFSYICNLFGIFPL